MNSEDLFYEAMRRFEVTRAADREQRLLATEDLIFINSEDGQWSEDVVEKRKDRPRYTIDRISGALNQLIGNQRQTRTGIKVIPQTDGNEKTAQVLTGLIRSIEQLSNADNAYDSAFTEQITGGYGGWRILSDFESDDSFDQTLTIKPVNSASSSLFFDPAAQEYDKRDANFAFLTTAMLLEDFKEKYPDAAPIDFNHDRYKDARIREWFGEEGVRLAEYWYKIPFKKKIGLLSDGRVIDLEEEKKVLDELKTSGVTIVREREVQSFKIEMRVMSGVEFLTEPQQWAGKHIPLVPVYGETALIDNRMYIRGKVRKAKDAQRIYNYATSAAIEATALTPKDPIWITPEQAKGNEVALRNFPTQNSPFMMYNPDPLSPGAPQRGGAPQLQTALLQQVNQAATDIHSTTGLEPASLGNVPELKSGKAIEAQQAMGDRGSYIYQDNLRKSKQYTGEILVDLIPRIYDTERVIKVLGADENIEEVTINEHQYNDLNEPILDRETGDLVIVNDLSLGKYSVTVTTGQNFATKRQETVNQLVNLSASSPMVQELALDLIVDNMDLNKGDEIKSRIRKRMIEQGIVKPSEEETKELGLDRPPTTDPMNDALIKNLDAQTEKLFMQNEKIIAEIENKDADTQSKIIAAQKDSVSALTNLMQTMLDKIEKGFSVSENEVDLVEGQQALVQETQDDVLENQELAGSVPLTAKNLSNPQLQQPQPLQQLQPSPPQLNQEEVININDNRL